MLTELNIFHWVFMEGVLAEREKGVVRGITARVRVRRGIICKSKALFFSQYLLEWNGEYIFSVIHLNC